MPPESKEPVDGRERPALAVLIVTHNSEEDLPACLEAVGTQTYGRLELVIVDCLSSDRSVQVAESSPCGDVPKIVRPLGANLGFAGGMNAALQLTDAPYVAALNADALPAPDFFEKLARHLDARPKAAAVTGRLIRAGASTETDEPRRLDACGMYLVRTWRHLDRGSGELDEGQFSAAEKVFGATGAATLYRRAALDDVAIPGSEPSSASESFDTLFHSYREDAELCFRFQERGWDVIYEPEAAGGWCLRAEVVCRRSLTITP